MCRSIHKKDRGPAEKGENPTGQPAPYSEGMFPNEARCPARPRQLLSALLEAGREHKPSIASLTHAAFDVPLEKVAPAIRLKPPRCEHHPGHVESSR